MARITVTCYTLFCARKCLQSKLSTRHRMYHCNDVTTGDQKLTKNLIIENNLPKANSECRPPSGTPLHVIPSDTATSSRTDAARYVDLASATVPDVCEPFFGNRVAAQRQTEEVFNVPAAFNRIHLQVSPCARINRSPNVVNLLHRHTMYLTLI